MVCSAKYVRRTARQNYTTVFIKRIGGAIFFAERENEAARPTNIGDGRISVQSFSKVGM